MASAPPPKSSLRELALLFLRLGCTAFGGPAAHIAMMQAEVVTRRKWLAPDEFLDLLGATNLIPGPNSTELAIHIGLRRGGWRGLVVTGVCFITPAALMSALLAFIYLRLGRLPEAQGVLRGIKPVIVAVVVQALVKLARTAIRSRFLAAMTAAALVAVALRAHELVVLLVCGAVTAAFGPREARALRSPTKDPPAIDTKSAEAERTSPPDGPRAGNGEASGLAAPTALLGLSAAVTPLLPLFFVFLKIGSILFGSGYALLAFLRADLVERRHWLTESQLLDAIAVGQLTPGPVLSTSSFIGYVLGGGGGAVAATVGIFLPAFAFVAMSAEALGRLRRSRIFAGFLDGVNVASLALLALVTFDLGRAALVDLPSLLLFAGAGALLVHYDVNSAWLVLGGAAIGTALGFAGL